MHISNHEGIITPKTMTYHFSAENYPTFYFSKLDLDILIFCKLVPCVTWKDGIALNKTLTQPKNGPNPIAKHFFFILSDFYLRFLNQF